MNAEPTVRENEAEHRFEIWTGPDLAGYTVYRRQRAAYALIHTEIEPPFEGEGLGSVLVRQTLDGLRERGFGVLPYCPFVRSFIQRHSDYLSLVPVDRRDEFGLDS